MKLIKKLEKKNNEFISKEERAKLDKEWEEFIFREYPGSTRYKLRAESPYEVFDFIDEYPDKIWRIKIEQTNNLPDCEFEFTCFKTLDEIRNILMEFFDGHVMVQTVQPIEKYTGERDFDIEC